MQLDYKIGAINIYNKCWKILSFTIFQISLGYNFPYHGVQDQDKVVNNFETWKEDFHMIIGLNTASKPLLMSRGTKIC